MASTTPVKTTENSPSIGIRPEDLRAINQGLTQVLSDTFTLALKRVLNSETSKLCIVAAPLLPARMLFHVSSTEWPTGVSIPIPVTTTLLPINGVTPLLR